MPSITSWFRLEPQPSAGDVDGGIAARVYDPLWLLARQWQVGEFQAEDGGTPVVARWRAQVAPLRRYHLGPIPAETQEKAPQFTGPELPLETFVEQQSVDLDELRLAVETGRHFLRMLQEQSTARDYTTDFIASYAVAAGHRRSRPGDRRLLAADGRPGAGRAPAARHARAHRPAAADHDDHRLGRPRRGAFGLCRLAGLDRCAVQPARRRRAGLAAGADGVRVLRRRPYRHGHLRRIHPHRRAVHRRHAGLVQRRPQRRGQPRHHRRGRRERRDPTACPPRSPCGACRRRGSGRWRTRCWTSVPGSPAPPMSRSCC